MSTEKKANGNGVAEAEPQMNEKAKKAAHEKLKASRARVAAAEKTLAAEKGAQSAILSELKAALGGASRVRIDGHIFTIACRKGVHYLHGLNDDGVVDLV